MSRGPRSGKATHGNKAINSIYGSTIKLSPLYATKRVNEFSEDEIKDLIVKANDYMKLKPWKTKTAVAKYIGVTLSGLIKWSKEGRVELPLPRRPNELQRTLKIRPIYKEIKSSWVNK
tara:strand:+ start:1448 stop:1801 length:354 start_codon:yes stop_codon:yes gene_type:complete